MAASWEDVCSVEDIPTNSGVCALVGGNQVALFKVVDSEGTRVFGIDNFDPFGKANVLSRGIVGDVDGELVVASPLYKQHFKLATGQCVEEAMVGVSSYEIKVEGDRVFVGL